MPPKKRVRSATRPVVAAALPLPAAVVPLAPTASFHSSNANRTLLGSIGIMTCMFTSAPFALCDAAHIFPKGWISDGSYSSRLHGLHIGKADLEAVGNFLLLNTTIHRAFDRGAFGLQPQRGPPRSYKVKHRLVTGAIATDAGLINFLTRSSVVHDTVINIPHANPRIMKWHWDCFSKFVPTAAASESSDDDPPRAPPTDTEAAAM